MILWIINACLGFLDSVSNLSAVLSPESIVFTWLAPYSLDRVPILGYSVHVLVTGQLNATVFGNSSVTIDNTTTNFSVPKTDVLQCAKVNITIYSVNAVGSGEASEYSTSFVEGQYT